MAMGRRIVALAVALVGVAALAAESEATAQGPAPTFPFDAELAKARGFYATPDVHGSFVLAHPHNYLQPPARLHVLSATGPIGLPTTFCSVEYEGKRGYVHCDDAAALKTLASSGSAPSAGGGSTPAWPSHHGAFGVTCGHTMEACTAFCKQACDILPSGGAHCPRVPTGEGLLPESSPLLKELPHDLKYVKTDHHDRGTSDTIDGLRRLDAWLASSPDRAKYNYTLHVSNCWRDGITDTQKECYFILKGKDPRDLKLAMPGATPHSSGKACDIHLIDAQGHNAVPNTACSAGASTGASIDFKTASRLLDEALTNGTVGAQRLDYEAWHYEWGGVTNSCRCKAPDCQAKFWPPTCRPSGCSPH